MSFKIMLASPRGFCAGVERAIEIVNLTLSIYPPPVYVRHEIVHNRHVVEDFKSRGVVFVDRLDEVPDNSVVIFSAHGVSPDIRSEADQRGLNVIDATCPLVTKVHLELLRCVGQGYYVILIGHAGHAEVIGTMGEAPDRVFLVGSISEAEKITPPASVSLAYLTQTTLSVDETKEIVDVLKKRFPDIVGPQKDDICFATQNRQDAVKSLADTADVIIVLGSPNSSNSMRLREVAISKGINSYLIDEPSEIDAAWVKDASCVGITAGASSPEFLVQKTIDRLLELGAEGVSTLDGITETVQFALPQNLIKITTPPPDTQPKH